MNCEPRFWRDDARVTPLDAGRSEFDWMKLALNDAAPLGLDHDDPGGASPTGQVGAPGPEEGGSGNDVGRASDTSWRWPTGPRIRHPLRPARGGSRREPPRRRVPDCDIVYVGAAPPPADIVDVLDLAPAPASEKKSGRKAKARRNLTRPLLVLLLLEVAIVGVMHVRKRMADAHVIVVPVSLDKRSVIT
jgi:hypothetical protein